MPVRTGVFICSCGPNIGGRMDIERIAAEAAGMKGVVLAETFGLLCSPKGKQYLAERIRENRLDRVVIAACSPREHEATFMQVCESAGLNPFMMEMANIREQVAWVTADPQAATLKALRMVMAAVSRIDRHIPLQKTSIVCNPEVLVVGGGIAGMTASLMLADADRRVTLLERNAELGGMTDGETARKARELAGLVSQRGEITVLTGREPREIVGFFGNFIVGVGDGHDDVRIGSIVLATGCRWSGPGTAEPAEGFADIARMLRVPLDEAGFPGREHDSLAPVSTPIDGIHLAGCAGGPCSLEETVRSAEAVAGTILSTLVPGREVETEPRTSVISETLCRGCRTCMDVCGFGAISFNSDKNICTVNGVLCKGCGNCAAACPSGAVRSMHFTPDQLRYQMTGALR
jgi:heterodisulfide reductase subunit A-like polyferredoxin